MCGSVLTIVCIRIVYDRSFTGFVTIVIDSTLFRQINCFIARLTGLRSIYRSIMKYHVSSRCQSTSILAVAFGVENIFHIL